MALTKTLTMPAVPMRRIADGLGFGNRDDARGDAGDFDLAHVGQRDRNQHAEGDAAEQVGENTQDQLATTAPQLALPSSRASGTRQNCR